MGWSTDLLSKLSRVTTSKRFIPEIDGLRFFAIATVVLYHLNTHLKRVGEFQPALDSNWLDSILIRGGLGVQVFFAISGFILALPFASRHLANSKKVELKPYYIRRLTRLEPPYFISLVLFVVAQVFLLDVDFKELFPHFLASLFYIHNIVYDAWSTVNPVAWSLEVEVQFYLLAPFLATVFSISRIANRRLVLVLIIVICLLTNHFLVDFIEVIRLRKSLITSLQYFMIGFVATDWFLIEGKKQKEQKFSWDLVGIMAIIGLFVFSDITQIFNHVIFLVSILLLFIAVFRGKILNTFFVNKWIVTIGGMCYTIYLLHYGFLAFAVGQTKDILIFKSYVGQFLVQFSMVIPLLLVVCALYFALAERPFMFKNWPQSVSEFFSRKLLGVYNKIRG